MEGVNPYLTGLVVIAYTFLPWVEDNKKRLEFLVYTVEVVLQEMGRANLEKEEPEVKLQTQIYFAESDTLLSLGKSFLDKGARVRIDKRLLTRKWVYFIGNNSTP